MNKWKILLLVGFCIGLPMSQGAVSATANSYLLHTHSLHARSQQAIQAAYFAKMGLGANYGPHYNAFDSYLGYTNYSDAKNSVMESSVPVDFQQLQDAGFQTVRAYGDSAQVWIAMINEATPPAQTGGTRERHHSHNNSSRPPTQTGGSQAPASGSKMNIVYTVALCGSNIDDPNHCCLKGVYCSGPRFFELLSYAKIQLGQVIDQVGPKYFQNAVKLVLVGNEALVASPAGHLNTADLVEAIREIKQFLTSKGIKLGDGNGQGVDVSTCVVIGQMSTSDGKILAKEFTPGAPVVENIYPFQFFGTRPTDLGKIKERVAALRKDYPDRPIMIGETGWATRGTFIDGATRTITGSLADAQTFYRVLYPYLQDAKIPALGFESFDQPSKNTAKADLSDSEQNYGVFKTNNTMKAAGNVDFFPNKQYKPKPAYDTSRAAVFTFIGWESRSGTSITNFTPKAVTVKVIQPNGFQLTRTYKPFALKTQFYGDQMVWPSVNLYAGSKVTISFTGNSGNVVTCTNTVQSINATPRHNPGGADFPAFSGGVWTRTDLTCPGCPKIDWGHNDGINAQNVFLHPDWN
jgi:hypothetical protein